MKTNIEQIGIIGSGKIGMSFAALFTGNGYNVVVYGIDQQEIEKGSELYHNYYKDLVNQKLVTERQAELCEKRLAMTTSYGDLADAELLYECAVENIKIKRDIYKEAERHCKKFRAIASATSAISADDLAQEMTNKEKLCVAHPWNPPHLAPCVEVVKSKETSDEVIELVVNLLESVGREVVVMQKSIPGFVLNRLHHALFREAIYLVETGVVTPEDIDRMLRTSIMPRYTSVGFFQYHDYIGLDMIKSIHDYLFPTLCKADHAQDLINGLYEKGELGYKTGKGVFDWSDVDIDEFREKVGKPFYAFFNWNLPNEDEKERRKK